MAVGCQECTGLSACACAASTQQHPELHSFSWCSRLLGLSPSGEALASGPSRAVSSRTPRALMASVLGALWKHWALWWCCACSQRCARLQDLGQEGSAGGASSSSSNASEMQTSIPQKCPVAAAHLGSGCHLRATSRSSWLGQVSLCARLWLVFHCNPRYRCCKLNEIATRL